MNPGRETEEIEEIHVVAEDPEAHRYRMWLEQSSVMGNAIEQAVQVLIQTDSNVDGQREIAQKIVEQGARIAVIYDQKASPMSEKSKRERVAAEEFNRANGIRTEIAVTLSFLRAGFTVVRPTTEEDLNSAVDLYIISPGDKEMGQVIAIQIKAVANMVGAAVENLDTKTVIGTLPELGEHRQADIDRSANTMQIYTRDTRHGPRQVHPEQITADHTITPLIIYVPSGREERLFLKWGEPAPGFAENIVNMTQRAIVKPTKPTKS